MASKGEAKTAVVEILDDHHIRIVGALREGCNLNDLLKAKAPLEIDVSGVTAVNSTGILMVLGLLNKWGKQPFTYVECQKDFAHQIVMLPAMLGVETTPGKHVGSVKSCYIPFECQECNTSQDTLIEQSSLDPNQSVESQLKATCQNCGAALFLDDSMFDFGEFIELAMLAPLRG